MGTQERKEREREHLRQKLIACAHEMLAAEGLDGLTMRALAKQIEYSQSKIYTLFKGKDDLCEVLCSELCEKLLMTLKAIQVKASPEEYLKTLILKTIEFHGNHRYSDTLFTLICFSDGKYRIPEAFSEVEALLIEGLRNIESPLICNDEQVADALDIIRCIFIGVSTLMNMGEEGAAKAIKMTNNTINILIKGWKS